MITIHNINKIPDGHDYLWGNLSEFDEYDLDDLKLLELDEAWYWYVQGSYEGSGQILMRRGDLYDLADCGHCSCYGPVERISFRGMPFEDLIKIITPELLKESIDLFKAAGHNPDTL